MSDISLGPGLGVALGSFLTLAVGGVLLVAAVLLGLLLPPGGERRVIRALRFSAGPLTCLAAGAALLGVGSLSDKPALERLDEWSLTVPVIGVVVAASMAIAVGTAQRARRSNVAWKVALRGAALAAVVALALVSAGGLILQDWAETRQKVLLGVSLPVLAALAAGLAGALARPRPRATAPRAS